MKIRCEHERGEIQLSTLVINCVHHCPIEMRTLGKGWPALHFHCADLQRRVTTSKLLAGNGQCPMLTPKMKSV